MPSLPVEPELNPEAEIKQCIDTKKIIRYTVNMPEFLLPSDLNGIHIHFTGIKGTGMAALTEIFHARGAVITGSDVSDVFYTDAVLARIGIRALPFSADNITDTVVCVIHSSAYNAETNSELAAAVKKHIPCLLYSDALGQLSAHAYSCGIAGVHGKTTTTGLTGTILKELQLPVQVLAGSIISSFGGSEGSCTLSTGRKYFVAETCEYQRHFLSFHPQEIILTSVESDHQDYYPTYEAIRDAFVEYGLRLPDGGKLIYCADDPGAVEAAGLIQDKRPDIHLVPYGEQADGPFRLVFGGITGGRQYFYLGGFGRIPFFLRVPGRHLVRNATAAVALSLSLFCREYSGVPDTALFSSETAGLIARGLDAFRGGKRRSELVGSAGTVLFIDDYGHHPTAIRTTLEGYRAFYPDRKLIVDFMAHTYTRTAALLDDFAGSFFAADEVILHKIYGSAREQASASGVTGRSLFEKTRCLHPSVRYYDEVMDARDDLFRELSRPDPAFPAGTVFVTMGAGDNWKLGRALLQDLSE